MYCAGANSCPPGPLVVFLVVFLIVVVVVGIGVVVASITSAANNIPLSVCKQRVAQASPASFCYPLCWLPCPPKIESSSYLKSVKYEALHHHYCLPFSLLTLLFSTSIVHSPQTNNLTDQYSHTDLAFCLS